MAGICPAHKRALGLVRLVDGRESGDHRQALVGPVQLKIRGLAHPPQLVPDRVRVDPKAAGRSRARRRRVQRHTLIGVLDGSRTESRHRQARRYRRTRHPKIKQVLAIQRTPRRIPAG